MKAVIDQTPTPYIWHNDDYSIHSTITYCLKCSAHLLHFRIRTMCQLFLALLPLALPCCVAAKESRRSLNVRRTMVQGCSVECGQAITCTLFIFPCRPFNDALSDASRGKQMEFISCVQMTRMFVNYQMQQYHPAASSQITSDVWEYISHTTQAPQQCIRPTNMNFLTCQQSHHLGVVQTRKTKHGTRIYATKSLYFCHATNACYTCYENSHHHCMLFRNTCQTTRVIKQAI